MKEGHIIILVCIILGYFAYHFYRKEKYTSALGFILLGAAVLKVYMSGHLYFNAWDEKYHALVARNLAEHPFKPTLVDKPVLKYYLQNWVHNHVWLHKQPMMLWMMALSIKIFGTHEWAVRLPSLIMSIITIILTYKISEKLFNSKIACVAAFCFAIVAYPTSMAAGLNATDHVDTGFLFFITLAIYMGITAVQKNKRRLFVLCGFLTGIAVLTKWLPGLIVIPLIGIYMLGKKEIKMSRKIWTIFISIVVAGCTFLPWQFYIFSAFPEEAKWEFDFNSRHIFEVIEGHGGSAWFHVDAIVKFWTFMFYIFIPTFVFYVVKDKLKWRGILIIVWIFIPLIFFSIAQTKMSGYTLFIYPAIAIAAGYVIIALSQLQGKWKPISGLITFIFICFLSVQSIDYLKLNNKKEWETSWSNQIKKMSKEKRDKPLVIINAPSYIEAMFYIDNCTAYEPDYDTNTVDSLKLAGYEVLRYDLDKHIYVQQ